MEGGTTLARIAAGHALLAGLLVAGCTTETPMMPDAGSCPASTESCDGLCVDTAFHPEHCGACGNACAPGEVCSGGACDVYCTVELRNCDGLCVDTQMDVRHCGRCGEACSRGRACEEGRCVLSCSPDLDNCSGVCRDTTTDRRHCGACDSPCGTDDVCVAGSCTPSCGGSFTNCGGSCRDTMGDEAHCGACDAACGPGEICSSGTCELNCPPMQMECGGFCRDTQNDASHCGACDAACVAGEICEDGACVPTLPATTVPPQTISGSLSCTTRSSTNGRKVAIDAGGGFYAIMICGVDVYAVSSTSSGFIWTAPMSIGLPGASEAAIVGGPSDTAYVVGADPAGGTFFTRTTDGGTTWSTPVMLPGAGPGRGSVSIAARGTSVWVAATATTGRGLTVWRNSTSGSGAFSSIDVTLDAAYFDVLVEPSSGDVWLASDNPTLHLRRSTDGGATFMPEGTPPAGAVFYSDWTMADGAIFTAGGAGPMTTAAAYRIDPRTLTSTPLTLGTMADLETRSISADAAGRVYTACVDGAGMGGGPVVLEHLAPGSTSFTGRLTLSMTGEAPSIVAVPDVSAALVVYTEGTAVRAATQAF